MTPPPHRLASPGPPRLRRAGEVALVVLGTLVAQVAAVRASALLLPAPQTLSGQVMLQLVLPGLVGLAWLWFALLWQNPHGRRELGLGLPSPRWLRISLLAAVGCLVLGALVKLAFEPLFGTGNGLLKDLLPADVAIEAPLVLGLLIGAGLLAPVVEEMLFRGLLYRWLRQGLRVWPAALLAALPHALLHFDAAATPSLVVIFVIAALLYEASGSLWCPIIVHGGHNLLSLSAALLARMADLA